MLQSSRMMLIRAVAVLELASFLHAWLPTTTRTLAPSSFRRPLSLSSSSSSSSSSRKDDNQQQQQQQQQDGWSVTDDWSAMSAAENRPVEGRDVFHWDVAERAAARLQQNATTEVSAAETWLHDSIGRILSPDEDNDQEDSSSSTKTMTSDSARDEEMEATEVARLVRCQEVPQALLIAEGRAIPDLTWEVAHDVRQLIRYNSDTSWWQATPFMKQAVKTIFEAHASLSSSPSSPDEEQQDTLPQWDATAVASWMRQSLQETCGKHDPRVLTVLSRFGRKGYLCQQGLVDLYVDALVGQGPRPTLSSSSSSSSSLTHIQIEQAYQRFMKSDAVAVVWRDFKRHGVNSPAEQAHAAALQAIEEAHEIKDEVSTNAAYDDGMSMIFMDECEIVESTIPDGWYKDENTGAWQRRGKSSHEKVALTGDGKTPLWLQDGDYVYIDEESCIGCTQCALAAPASFQMLENGRARTFLQRGRIPDVQAAVKTCPVNCMHYVDFARLTHLEKARDSPDGDDGRTDHRHFGRDRKNDKWRAHTPLHVSRMESSDANHKDSLYHHVVRQCYKSNQCPQKGCYDCPLHRSNPQANPYLLQRRQQNNHVRAQAFQKNGMANSYRKTADL